jgi:hypothetical protein
MAMSLEDANYYFDGYLKRLFARTEYLGKTMGEALTELAKKVDPNAFAATMQAIGAEVGAEGERMLQQNFGKSGIVSRTGAMRRAVFQARGGIRQKTKTHQLGLRWTMLPGKAPYVSKKGHRTPFYEVAGALQYGAIRHKGVGTRLGADAKRTLKYMAMGGDWESRRAKQLRKRLGGVNITMGGTGALEVHAPKLLTRTVVVKPFDHFDLNPSQRKYLMEKFVSRVIETLEKMIRGADA